MYLVIDTSTRHGAVGIWRDGTLARTLAWRSRHNHTAELMPAVDEVLKGIGAAPKELTGIVVAHGPGGFSALRVGLGAAKGLAFAVGAPLVGISTLEASAYPYRGVGLPVCSIIESGRDLMAWARFQETAAGWKRRTADRITPSEALLAARGRHTLFCGEGVTAMAERLQEAMGARAHMVSEQMPLSRLAGLAELGAARLDAGDVDDIAAVRPRYLRAPTITPPRPPRA